MPQYHPQPLQQDPNLIQNQVIQEKIELFDHTNSTISQKSGGSGNLDNENVLLTQQFFEPNDPLRQQVQALKAKQQTLTHNLQRRKEHIEDLKDNMLQKFIESGGKVHRDDFFLAQILDHAMKLQGKYNIKINQGYRKEGARYKANKNYRSAENA